MSILYTVPGFEPLQHQSPPITTSPGHPLIFTITFKDLFSGRTVTPTTSTPCLAYQGNALGFEFSCRQWGTKQTKLESHTSVRRYKNLHLEFVFGFPNSVDFLDIVFL